MKYDYGDPARGLSFEHWTFYDTFVHMGHDVIYFDFMSLVQVHGPERMNRLLLDAVRSEKPDLLFCVLFQDEIDPAVIRHVSENTDTVTLNWFTDDHWRFDSFSRHWAPCFNWVVTTSQSAWKKYAALGYRNVIKSQWACNHFSYRKLDLPLAYDVTFVGMAHGDRRQVIAELQRAGINVRVWGFGWETGRLSQEDMIRVFNQSRINLNFTNPISVPRKRRFMIWKNWRRDARNQIKGRTFEVPGCGGFLLTGRAEDLEDYYVDGKEVVIFKNIRDLINKIRYYLTHEDERATIAQAGYERTLREHTYEKRFREILARIGLEA